MDDLKEELRVTFRILLLSGVILITGIFYNFSNATDASWFQRSGTLLIVLSIFAEINILKIDRMISQLNQKLNFEEYNKLKRVYERIIIFFLVVGTLISGYGDLIYEIFY